jgi:hypothetical protein
LVGNQCMVGNVRLVWSHWHLRLVRLVWMVGGFWNQRLVWSLRLVRLQRVVWLVGD